MVGVPLNCATCVVVHWIAARRVRTPHVRAGFVEAGIRQPLWALPRGLARRRVLLPPIWPSRSHHLHPGLHHRAEQLRIAIWFEPETFLDDVERHDVILAGQQLKTITIWGNLVFVTRGTSGGLKASHLLFLVICSWSWQKFFSSEKKPSVPGSSGCLGLFRSFLAFFRWSSWALAVRSCALLLLSEEWRRNLFSNSFIVANLTFSPWPKTESPYQGPSSSSSAAPWRNPATWPHQDASCVASGKPQLVPSLVKSPTLL